MAENNNNYLLTTISLKVPRLVEDQFRRIAQDTGLTLSRVGMLTLSEVGRIFERHWRPGMSLQYFLGDLERWAKHTTFFSEVGAHQDGDGRPTHG